MQSESLGKSSFWHWFGQQVATGTDPTTREDRGAACLGIDVGGANLKFALVGDGCEPDCVDSRKLAKSVPFPLWKNPEGLADALDEAVKQLAIVSSDELRIGVTMTGELADCFETKAEGVRRIVQHCELGLRSFSRSIQYYSHQTQRLDPNHGSVVFVDGRQSLQDWQTVAAANWHAVANLISRWTKDWQDNSLQNLAPNGLVLDLGSTTLDLTPVKSATVATGKTDFDRLCEGELLYTGVGRSPLSGILSAVNFQRKRLSLAQELFATSADVYLLTGDVPENPIDLNTADGRPSTKGAAAQRIARMFCSDVAELPPELIQAVCAQAKENQLSIIESAIAKVLLPEAEVGWVAICGQGEFLLRQAIDRIGFSGQVVSLWNQLGSEVSAVAPAFAIAALLKLEKL